MKSKYTVTIEYTETTEYTIKLDPVSNAPSPNEYYPSPDEVIDHYEEDPKYIVHETSYFEDGSEASYDNLATFDTYKEAIDFIKEQEGEHHEG